MCDGVEKCDDDIDDIFLFSLSSVSTRYNDADDYIDCGEAHKESIFVKMFMMFIIKIKIMLV